MSRTVVMRLAVASILLASLSVYARGPASTQASLKLILTVTLPGFSGDFDHLTADVKGGRLFLAGEDHKSVEVFDLQTGKKLHSITEVGTPHSLLYLPEQDELYVTDGADGTLKIFSGSDYKLKDKIQLVEGLDSIVYDRAAQRLYVVSGGKDVPLDHSFLTAVDLPGRKTLGEIRFEADHVEAMAIETSGSRLFVNLADKAEVAVVDRKKMQVIARWPVGIAEQNSPLAYDEKNQRLFVVCRKPPMLVVMDATNGKVVASLPTAGHADDVAFDKDSGRIYVPGAEGFISVYQQKDADHYEQIAKVQTAPGAKTAVLVPELHRLFVAVSPGDTKAMAKLLVYEVTK
jgi:DNA-binding beta-propeller fold protein YncE